MFPASGSKSDGWYGRALEVMPGGSTRKALYDVRSYVQTGDGCRVRDIDGNSILDASNNFMVLIHGHRHPPTIDAIRAQLERGISFGLPVTDEVDLAEHLCDRVASIERIVFCNTGSEAVMQAMKAARAITQRPKIVKCEGLYHGSYDYAEVSNTPPVTPGAQGFPHPLPFGPYTLPHVLDDVVVIPFNDVEIAETIIRRQADTIAGIIVDPVPSRIGYALADDCFLRMLRAVSVELGIVLIFDEVASFRVAHGGAQALYDVKPDLTVLGKIIGGGMQIGAIGGSESMMRIFDPSTRNTCLPFTGTFNGHPVSMAAGLATLQDYTVEAVARLNELGDVMRNTIRSGIHRLGLPAQVGGYASFVSLYFAPRVGNGYHTIAHRPEELPLLRRFWSVAMDRRLLVDVSARINLSTAYAAGDVEEACEIILASLAEAFDSESVIAAH